MLDVVLVLAGLLAGLLVGRVWVWLRNRGPANAARLVVKRSARDRYYYLLVGEDGKTVAMSTAKFSTEEDANRAMQTHLGRYFQVDSGEADSG